MQYIIQYIIQYTVCALSSESKGEGNSDNGDLTQIMSLLHIIATITIKKWFYKNINQFRIR